MRLGAVRGFARYLHEVDPRVEVPAADLLPDRPRRAVPYLYTDEQILALMGAASTLRTSHKAATFRTLFGLLAVTGMRIGEAIALDRDVDPDLETLVIRHGKFGKSRELPLHPSTTGALTRYLCRRGRPQPADPTEALLVSTVGTRLLMSDVQTTFRLLRARAGIGPRSAACRPRLHEYADLLVMPTLARRPCSERFSVSSCRHNQSASRKARSASGAGSGRVWRRAAGCDRPRAVCG
jgi:integrase